MTAEAHIGFASSMGYSLAGWFDWIPGWMFNYKSFEETENENLKSIGIVTLYNILIAFLFWVYWTYKRWNDPGFFSCKRAERPSDLPGPRNGMLCGTFAFLRGLYRISEEDFIRFAGFDALVYTRMYLLAGRMLSVISLYALPVILPINFFGGFEETDNTLSKMSMSNVAIKSDLLWFHVFGIFFVTGVSLFFLKREFRVYIRLRQRYLQQRKPHMRTIMLDVPPDARSNAILESYFGYMYPGSVLTAACTQDLSVLRGLLTKRESVITRLERTELQRRASKTGEEPKIWTGPCCCLGDRVGAVGYLTQELSYYNTEVSREQAKRLHHLRKMDQRALQLASQGTLQQAIQAIMAQGGGQILDDEETGLVEQLLARSSRVQVYDDEVMEEEESYDDDDFDDAEIGIRRGSGRMGFFGSGAMETPYSLTRWRFGSRAGSSPDSFQAAVAEAEAKAEAKGASSESPRRGCGALFSSGVFGSGMGTRGEGEQGSGSPEQIPLLGRSKSSFAIRKINFPAMTPRAFVTFKTFSAATVARQVLHGAAPGRMAAEESPEPRDIYWFNTRVSQKERKRRRILVESFLAVLYVFYVVPVTLLYLLLSADSVTSYARWIKELYQESSIVSAIVELLQPMALLALMNTLPPLIRLLGMVEGFSAESRNQQAVLSRYFYFQVINVFLVTTIAGTVIDTVSSIVEDPTTTFTLLGESLPKVAGFFVEYIILKLFVGLGVELTRLVALMQEYILRIIWPRKTPRDRAALVMGLRPYFDAGWFNYPKYIAQDLLVVVVCLTYSIINPFILVVGVPYFFACHAAYKHQMLFVYEPMYETGGVFFPKIFRRFIFAIIIAQATMVGILILKVAYYEAALVLLLMILTYVAKSSLRGSYEPSALSLPLEIAKVLDEAEPPRRRSVRDRGESEEGDPRMAYLQPSLKAEPLARPELERDHQANIDFERYRGRV